MLKYKINTKDIVSDSTMLNVSYWFEEEETNDNKTTLYCKFQQDNEFNVGDTIKISGEIVTTENYARRYTYHSEYVDITHIDIDNSVFELLIDKYYQYNITDIEEISEVVEDEIKYFWVFTFDTYHYFNEDDEKEGIQLECNINGEDFIFQNCKLHHYYQLKWEFNKDDEKISDLGEMLFGDRYCPRGTGDFYILSNIKRKSLFKGENVTIGFFKEKINLSINLPISNVANINLFQETKINEKFVEFERKSNVNNYTEMEKVILHPILFTNKDILPIKNININVHLREHNGGEWKTEEKDYWNGVIKRNITQEGEIFSLLEVDDKQFSHPYVVEKKWSFQSDNISKLGFGENDVKFQKSKLKKTFLRLSFYDSDDINNQNLIAYSTVFINSNKLFTNYVKNITTRGYKTYKNNEIKSSIGLNVNSEIDSVFEKQNQIQFVDDNCEDYRLSSRFNIKDRNTNQSSSEGFYIYVWKDYFNGSYPNDLYLHVDLNHAGYGRVLPLMFPHFGPIRNDYWDGKISNTWYNNEEEYKGIKSIHDIVNDWNYGGYDMRRYLKYSFIHLKCKYDNKLDKYVYYLDNEYYGQNVNNLYDTNTKTLNLNLYEGKISNGNEMENESFKDVNITIKEIGFSKDNKTILECLDQESYMGGYRFLINGDITIDNNLIATFDKKNTTDINGNKYNKCYIEYTYNLPAENKLWDDYEIYEDENILLLTEYTLKLNKSLTIKQRYDKYYYSNGVECDRNGFIIIRNIEEILTTTYFLKKDYYSIFVDKVNKIIYTSDLYNDDFLTLPLLDIGIKFFLKLDQKRVYSELKTYTVKQYTVNSNIFEILDDEYRVIGVDNSYDDEVVIKLKSLKNGTISNIDYFIDNLNNKLAFNETDYQINVENVYNNNEYTHLFKIKFNNVQITNGWKLLKIIFKTNEEIFSGVNKRCYLYIAIHNNQNSNYFSKFVYGDWYDENNNLLLLQCNYFTGEEEEFGYYKFQTYYIPLLINGVLNTELKEINYVDKDIKVIYTNEDMYIEKPSISDKFINEGYSCVQFKLKQATNEILTDKISLKINNKVYDGIDEIYLSTNVTGRVFALFDDDDLKPKLLSKGDIIYLNYSSAISPIVDNFKLYSAKFEGNKNYEIVDFEIITVDGINSIREGLVVHDKDIYPAELILRLLNKKNQKRSVIFVLKQNDNKREITIKINVK